MATALMQKNMNERFIQKYLAGYSEDDLKNFDQVLMEKASNS